MVCKKVVLLLERLTGSHQCNFLISCLSTFSSSSSQSVRSVKIAICPYYSLTPKPSADTPRAVISPSISSEIRETRDFRAKLIPNSPDSVLYFFCSVKNVYNHNVTPGRGL